MPRHYIRYLIMGLIVALIVTFYPKKKNGQQELLVRDYPQIRESGVLRVITEYNSISYFVTMDSIAGFDYELVTAFSNIHGVIPEITPEMSNEKRLHGLMEGKYDLIALPLPVTSELKDSIALSDPIILDKQILVQRTKEENDSTYISSLLQLADKTVHVVNGSPSILRLQNLSSEIGDTIYICEIDRYGEEQLLSMVAHGDINYLVCDESIALAMASMFPQLDFQTPVSFAQFYAWGVNKNSIALLDSINTWIKTVERTQLNDLYQKYYRTLE